MKMRRLFMLPVMAAVVLTGCAETPDAPTSDIMPPSGMSWAQFSQMKAYCQQQAKYSIEHSVNRRNRNGLLAGIATTVVGAGIGAAAGGGAGAALGAGAGALAGGGGGALYSNNGNSGIQRSYNTVYLQCMSASMNSGVQAQGYNGNGSGINGYPASGSGWRDGVNGYQTSGMPLGQ